MISVKQKAELLRVELKRLISEAEKKMMALGLSASERLEISDQIRFYHLLHDKKMETLLAVEQIKTKAFSGGKTGKKNKTIERDIFLKRVSEEIKTTKREAVAASAADEYSKETRQLWERLSYPKLQLKVLNYLKNHPIK